MQGPDTKHIVNLPFVLCQSEHHNKQGSRHRADHERPQRVHQIGAGADRHQARQWAVMDETRVVLAGYQCGQGAPDHRHERVHRHQAGYLVQRLGAHDVEAEPAHRQNPGAQGQERNVGRRMRGNGTVLAVAIAASAQQDHSRQCDPPANGMHHDRAREIMEFLTRYRLDPGLHAEMLVPGDALEERVDEADDDRGSQQLRPELGAFGNAARNDGGNGRRERQQEEELDQFIAILGRQLLGANEEAGAIRHRIADEEIHHRRD